MKMRYIKKIGIGLLFFNLVFSINVLNIKADEIKSTQENNMNTEEIDRSVEKNDRSNSWRYKDGERIPLEEEINGQAYFIPWSKVDGHFVNSRGEEIPGVVAKGVDVSEHQGKIDWNKVKQTDVDYAIIRCGYGMNYQSQDDKYWKYNADTCTSLGIPFGTYIYSYADSVERAVSEAEHVLRLVQGYELTYPIYYDLEENAVRNKLSSSEIAVIAKTFCDIIKDAGYEVGIYANTDWYNNYLIDPYFNTAKKWVAQYYYKCTYAGAYTMWQCTSSGYVDGINVKVDLNMDFGIIPGSLAPPAEVKNLKATPAGKNKVTLTWDKSDKAEGYLIYALKNGKYGYCGMTTQGTRTKFVDINALDMDYNYYWVFPYVKDRTGNMIPGNCEKYVYAKGIIPSVSNLKGASMMGGVRVSWTKHSEAEGYLIYGIRNGEKYSYIGMTQSSIFIDKKASKVGYNFYWVFPFHYDTSGKMVAGKITPIYVYGKAN